MKNDNRAPGPTSVKSVDPWHNSASRDRTKSMEQSPKTPKTVPKASEYNQNNKSGIVE